MSSHKDFRTYNRADCAVFRKTAEAFGGLSNMAPGYPVRINGVRILTVEALYQACRFPHLPEVQRKIIDQTSPMTAKMVGKPHRGDSRPDWDRVRVKIMRWVLRVKLATHWTQFSALLLSTGDMPIVEDSRKDDFWGAMPTDASTLVGMNVLGRLLMELREEIKHGAELRRVEPPAISDLLLFGEGMGSVDFRQDKSKPYPEEHEPRTHAVHDFQPSLGFDLQVEEIASQEPVDEASSVTAKPDSVIAKLKPYLEYQETGLPWVPSIPAHWNLVPNRALLKKRKVLVGANHINYQLLSLTKKGVIVRDVSSGKGKFSSDMGTSQEVRRNDFVFCLFDVPETPRTVGLSSYDGMITGAYTVFESRMLTINELQYFEQFYIVMDDRKLLSPLYSGLRHTIPPSCLLGTKTPQPPKEEQAAIVRFLKHANQRIDKLIRIKRSLIDLLNEQKQAITHQCITSGLSSSVELKPSGISWLGDIPKHWKVLRSKYLFREVDERSAHGKELHLSMSQKLGLIPNADIEVRRLVSDSYVGAKLCKKTDLVLNRLKAHLGVFALAPQPGLVSPDYTVLRPILEQESTYFEALYRSPACRVELYRRAKGIVQGFWRLYTDDFYAIYMPVPPISEQLEIMNYLNRALEKQSVAIGRAEREISLLQEYRARLTADIVTGKLDVREAATLLPDMLSDDSSGTGNAEVLEEESEEV
ncbi:MAG: NADAR domain-containing protein [Hydrogenophaga sp.]|uniref:NADAR domain-containing protein n=1 Tax=Hydrogenophaga sp. TaxID=1904254 RepID=UPI002715F2F4|nr:NADAR domain-containing protein [Hydrogenophaga sp.]MDO9032256.1 NADAR domain-containing protein [Hydrogenophaga sp.]